jgi:glutamine---fructose-6-phosphate transaminase (isomerizing)
MNINQTQHSQSSTWKEILSQGDVWQSTIDTLRNSSSLQNILRKTADKHEWIFIGCGTSFYLAEAAAFSWTLLTGQRARAIPGSEILLFPNLFLPDAAHIQAVVISRSGRTSEAVRAASVLRQNLQIPTLGITCARNSELEAACEFCIVLEAADEKSTVMTRSFTTMLLALQVLAARRADHGQFVEGLRSLAVAFSPRIPVLAQQMQDFVARHTFEDYVFLGQGPFHGIAREAALKVMEMSCSYSQFFHTLEFRHGPKSIVSPATCLTFLLSDSGYKAETEVLSEMKELGGVIVAICNRSNPQIRQSADLVIELDCQSEELAFLAPYTVPCQLLGLFTGLRKGLNPDQPKNLTRVVMLD